MIKIGDYVKWNDPCLTDYDVEEREIQSKRIYRVCDINDDVILISDNYGEVEAFEDELVVVNK